MSIEENIENLIEHSLSEFGYEVIRVRIFNDNRKVLQIMIDRIDLENITIGDCEKASGLISAILDVEDPIDDEYNLELSSPGLDRPLTKIGHFERFAGHLVKVVTSKGVDGRKNFKARLVGVKNKDQIELSLDSSERVLIKFGDIRSANIIIENYDFKKNKQSVN